MKGDLVLKALDGFQITAGTITTKFYSISITKSDMFQELYIVAKLKTEDYMKATNVYEDYTKWRDSHIIPPTIYVKVNDYRKNWWFMGEEIK